MSKLGIYHASESGGCPRALAAPHLGYEPVTKRGNDTVLKEGKRHEIHIAEDLAEVGYVLEDAGECLRCREEFGETGIGGHHIEITTPLVRLIGHIDRYLILNGQKYPCEFKSMGLFTFQKFKKEGLAAFPAYGAQVACYIGYAKEPALYVVKNRDNGMMLQFTVPYEGVVLPRNPIIPVLRTQVTLEQILDRLNLIESYVRTGDLPHGDEQTGCGWCAYRYLCSEQDKEEKNDLPEAAKEDLIDAANLWKEGKELEKQASEKIGYAKVILLQHAMQQTPKYQVGGLSVGYYGVRQRETLDADILKGLVDPEVLKKAVKLSKPYEDIRIKPYETI